MVDSETKIAILCHEWTQQRRNLNLGIRQP
jgi:hypothetical protein